MWTTALGSGLSGVGQLEDIELLHCEEFWRAFGRIMQQSFLVTGVGVHLVKSVGVHRNQKNPTSKSG